MSEYLLLLFLSATVLVASQPSSTRGDPYFKQSSELTEPTQQQTSNEIQRIMEALRLSKEMAELERQPGEMGRDLSYDYDADLSGNYGKGTGMVAAPSLFNQRLIMALRSSPVDDPYFRKRGKYMSLCHFKICNMGRKRWKSWP